MFKIEVLPRLLINLANEWLNKSPSIPNFNIVRKVRSKLIVKQ